MRYEENNQHKGEDDIFYCEKCRKLNTACVCRPTYCKPEDAEDLDRRFTGDLKPYRNLI